MSDSIPPLDPDVRALLREDLPAPAAVRSRARERLLAAALVGAPVAVAAKGSLAKAGALALAFLLGTGVGALVYATWRPPPAARIVYVDRPGPLEPLEPSPSAPTQPIVPPTALAIAPSAAPAAVSAPASTPPSFATAAQGPSQMSAERKLLDEARAALTQGDPARALAVLQRHRRVFPDALLGEERDAMWVQALVKAGRYDEARTHADAFHRRTPDSIFGSVVDSAIGSIP